MLVEMIKTEGTMSDNQGNIVIYQTDDGNTRIEVKMEEETVWLSQQQMSELYQTSRTNVVEQSYLDTIKSLQKRAKKKE